MLQRIRTARDEGFTLIELLIVIIILGILAAIVVFAVGNSSSDAKKNACGADKKTVETAAEAYKAKTGGYPGAVAADGTGAGIGNFTGGADPVLKEWPPVGEGITWSGTAVASTTCP